MLDGMGSAGGGSVGSEVGVDSLGSGSPLDAVAEALVDGLGSADAAGDEVGDEVADGVVDEPADGVLEAVAEGVGDASSRRAWSDPTEVSVDVAGSSMVPAGTLSSAAAGGSSRIGSMSQVTGWSASPVIS